MQYDEDVTNEFIIQVSSNYGPYVANKIIASIPQNLKKSNKQNSAER